MRRLLILLVLATSITPARASAEVVSFTCHGDRLGPGATRAVEAMENSYIEASGVGPCWFHTGHHTYDAGAPYAVGRVTGYAFTVETIFSPPTEHADGAGRSFLSIERSVDGLTWTALATVPYEIRRSRQRLDFDVDAGGDVARFIRIRQPRSAAQGLSGYLDHSEFDATLTPAPAAPIARSDEQNCAAHVMERFFAHHPCWFGGINRYDSPSVFHTYPITPGHVGRLSGRATLLPWRSDDFYYDGADPLSTVLVIQRSTDAVAWAEVARVEVPYGVSAPFDVAVGEEATFVRLVGEYHHGVGRHPALKHVRAFMFDSAISIQR